MGADATELAALELAWRTAAIGRPTRVNNALRERFFPRERAEDAGRRLPLRADVVVPLGRREDAVRFCCFAMMGYSGK
jgi:hypothetical protein